MSVALDTLARFAAKQATTHQVLRALAEHPHYFVALGFADALNRNFFDRLVLLSEQGAPPQGELYVFTDESCLDLVAGQPLGTFATPVSGIELFCALDGSVEKLKVNPGGPLSHFWFMGGDAIPLARLWGRAARLEALLADASKPKEALHAALRTFEAFTILVHPTGAVATAQHVGGLSNPAMVFTSPDSFEAVLQTNPTLRPAHLGAKELFELLPRAGVDGLAFNVMGPGARAVFPLSITTQVMQLA